MLSTSFEFRKRIAENSKVLMKATLTLADGTVANLSGDDFMMGTAAFSDAVSSDGSFDVGAAVIGQFSVSLNNYDGRFDEYDFTGASIVPYIGVELGAGGVEWLLKGHYFVEQPDSYGNTIAIKAFDNMHRFEEPYANVTTSYPATLRTIVQAICSHCGVVLADAAFANSTYSVAKRPDDSALSCLDIISHVAQVSGNFARCDTGGRLLVEWYDTAAFEGEDWLDGDRFDDATPYASGDDADGGNFLDYTSGDSVDGGAFGLKRFATIHAISNSTIVTDDVVITGVRVTAQDEVSQDGTQGNDGETYLYGSEGYVLDIGGNPLILYGRASAVAALIGPRVVGMRFRPFDLSAVGDPAIEAGDPAVVIDGHQNQYRTYLTSLTYKVGGYEAFSCSAETPSRNSAASYSALTKAIVKARNAVKRETTAREQAVDELARELAESSGLYMTRVEQPDHSYIYYMHDKPTLAESQIVWKLTANAFAISTDGGDTYPYGLDVTGNAILNRIYAIGLDASYIDTGRLVVGNAQDPMLLVDMDTGEVRINQLAYLAGRTVQSVLADVDSAGISNIEYGVSTSSSIEPTSWSETVPTSVAKGSWLWIRTTYNDGGTSITKAYAGTDGDDGVGITSVVSQYYLSTSDSSAIGGSWSDNPPTWSANKYIWTRSKITWATTPASTTYTTAVYDAALTQANSTASAAREEAADAAKVATNYLNFSSSTGLDVGYAGTSAKTRINGSGMEIFGGSGISAAYFGLDSNSRSYARIGTQEEEQGNVEIEVGDTPDSVNINLNRGTETLAAISYGRVHKYGVSSIWRGTFFTFGTRDGDGSYYPGSSSFVTGESNVARGERSFAGGRSNKVYGDGGFSYGSYNVVDAGYAIGSHLHVNGGYLACGSYNVYDNSTLRQFARLIVGGGDASSSRNAMVVYNDGDTVIAGTLTQSSDRRLKDHIEYLSDDAIEFVRELKPALFAMKSNGKRRLGFYAQDIQTAEPDGWMTDTVSEEAMSDEMPDLLTLDYTALIAPLVAYAQSLERRIEQLEARLAALEGTGK